MQIEGIGCVEFTYGVVIGLEGGFKQVIWLYSTMVERKDWFEFVFPNDDEQIWFPTLLFSCKYVYKARYYVYHLYDAWKKVHII